ncbi:uncharacterized protein LOC142344976 [Convolutriloba macropyga]|uniref:uncharacterized protein LOC142344976 n=1 Tax=Convolutriloba macropyga TaxID=536237 RepID=UPI003F524F37
MGEYMKASFSWNYDTNNWAFKGKLMRYLGVYYATDLKIDCVFSHLRALLTQYTTGPCILLLAVDRYISVCWATRAKQILSQKTRRFLCLALLFLNIAIFITAPTRALLVYYRSGRQRLSCETMMYSKYETKIVADLVMFYAIPAFVSIFLYSFTGYQLLSSRNNKKIRNRNLTIALIASTVYWFLCWLPNAFLSIYSRVRGTSSGLYQQEYWYYVLSEYRHMVYLSHAFCNPLFILFVSRRFQEPFFNWTRKHLGFCKAHNVFKRISKTTSTSGKTNSSTN